MEAVPHEGWSTRMQWRAVFSALGVVLLTGADAALIASRIGRMQPPPSNGLRVVSYAIDESIMETITIQLVALGLALNDGGLWRLTPKGQRLLAEMRAVRRTSVADFAGETE